MERLKEKVKNDKLNNQMINLRMGLAWLMIASGMIIIILSFID